MHPALMLFTVPWQGSVARFAPLRRLWPSMYLNPLHVMFRGRTRRLQHWQHKASRRSGWGITHLSKVPELCKYSYCIYCIRSTRTTRYRSYMPLCANTRLRHTPKYVFCSLEGTACWAGLWDKLLSVYLVSHEDYACYCCSNHTLIK